MKVGDYVRTRDDGIQKITFIDEFTLDSDEVFFGTDKTRDYADISTTDIIGKPSPNIIDLIEVGDYVNGEKVISLFNPMFLSMGELPYVITDKSKYEPQEIESIVTKEQFESMEYKLEENK